MKALKWKGRLRLFLWQRRRPLLLALSVTIAAALASSLSPAAMATLPMGESFLPWLLIGGAFVVALLAFLTD